MSDVVQRWRVVYARGPAARDLGQRDELEAWDRAIEAARLPVHLGAGDRPRLVFALPLPVGLDADAERFDLFLVARCTRHDMRTRLEPHIPTGHALIDVHDVWTGEPALSGRVVAADYVLVVDDGHPPDAQAIEALATAASAVLGAATLPRVRRRGERSTSYDLRPLLLGLRVEPEPGGRILVRARVRVDPALGAGRPDEVLAALGDAAERPVTLVEGRRERLWLLDEVADGV